MGKTGDDQEGILCGISCGAALKRLISCAEPPQMQVVQNPLRFCQTVAKRYSTSRLFDGTSLAKTLINKLSLNDNGAN